MNNDIDAERLFEYTSRGYRATGYARLTPAERTAWDTAHAALMVADGRARDAEVRVDRARARSRTTAAHLAQVNTTAQAAYDRRWDLYVELRAIERAADERVHAARADRFVDDVLEDGSIDGAVIVRPEDQSAFI